MLDVLNRENFPTELTLAQELFHELEAIISSSYDGMFITDGEGVVLRVNSAYERITGIKVNEVLGRNVKILVEEGYYDESVTVLVMEKLETITINQTIKKNRKILVTGNPIFDELGNLFRVVTNVRDITELADLQSKLLKTKEQTLKYKAELSHLRSLHIQDKEMISRSSKMAQVVELAMKIADVDSTVMINGESGTGKELIAKLIHKQGKGASKPFIKINCAAIPEQLLESELFGYEGGAFTGARKEGKPGLFELAHRGTLFLDEVGDLPLLLQVKLLRAIQEKEVLRVGGTKTIPINARIIAATHRDLSSMVKKGTFREDLYYRLMVVPIYLPPLRERKEDISLLAMHFIDKFNHRFGYNKKLMPQVIDKLMSYPWPGNVRELENVIERMVVTAPSEEMTANLLPENIGNKIFLPKRGTKLKEAVEQTEAYLLAESYNEYKSWQKVAEILGVDRTTIFRKVVRYKLGKA
ncbi:sigma-54 interaction domain-containing protein [Pelosinus sp. sgz500959]|uniref:sigma-54 interaction domain-containing protein n=1 Tax=Pelosinus sp. sgz500959 TaxID=3242472 RepID=UPI00366E3710